MNITKHMKKLLAIVVAVATVATTVAPSIPAQAAAPKAKKITLSATTKTIDIKGKATITVKKVTPSKASKAVKWKSSNKKVATVSSKGVVTGKKKGTVTITATSKSNKKVKKTIKIKVKELKPTSISLSKTSLNLSVGASQRVKATVKPIGVYSKGVVWSSNNSAVASVNGSGTIKANKAGSATITCKTKDKNSKGKYITKKVAVKVSNIDVTAVKFDSAEYSVYDSVGTDNGLKLNFVPANATIKDVTYTSSKTDVATVDAATGKITAKANGETVISVVSKANANAKASYTLKVVDYSSNGDFTACTETSTDGNLWGWTPATEGGSVTSLGYSQAQMKTDVDAGKTTNGKVMVLNLLDKAHYEALYKNAQSIPGVINTDTMPVGTNAQHEALVKYAQANKAKLEAAEKIVIVCATGNKGAKRAIGTLAAENANLKGTADAPKLVYLTGGATGIKVVTNVSFAVTDETLNLGATATNVATVTPDNALVSTVTYSSSDASVASVDVKTGKVSALKAGATTITATADDGVKNKASYKVTVKDPTSYYETLSDGTWGLSADKKSLGYKASQLAEDIANGKTASKEVLVLNLLDPSFDTATAALYTKVQSIPGVVNTDTMPVETPKQYADLQTFASQCADSNVQKVVIICKTGNTGAKRAISCLTAADSSIAGKLTYLIGGSTGWTEIAKKSDVKAYATDSDDNTVLVDARLTDAYQGWKLDSVTESGHIKDAVNVSAQWITCDYSVNSAEKKDRDASIAKALDSAKMTTTKNYIVYDTNGTDAYTVADYLKTKGYKNVKIYTALDDINAKEFTMDSYANYNMYVPASVVKNIADYKVNDVALSANASSIVGSTAKDNVVLLDVGWGDESSDPNTGSGYVDGHVAGAVHVNTDEYESPEAYSRKDVEEWRLNSDAELIKLAGDKGITKDSCVVITGYEPMATTRMAVILKYLGCENVHVMSEGMVGWNAAGYELAKGIVNPTATTFGVTTPENPDLIDTIAEAKTNKSSADWQLIDTRTDEEWNGTSSGYGYHDLKGRIENTIHSASGIGYSSSMYYYRNADKSMISKTQMEAMWTSQGIDPTKHMSFFCGSGWRAAEETWDAMVLGYIDVSLYSDGWIGWSNEGNTFINKDNKQQHFDLTQNKLVDGPAAD